MASKSDAIDRSKSLLADYEAKQLAKEAERLLKLLPQGEGSGLNADLLDGKHAREIVEEVRKSIVVKAGGAGASGLDPSMFTLLSTFNTHEADSEAHHPLGRSWPFILSTSGWGPTIVNTWQVIPGCTLTETFVDCYLLLDCWATIEDCNAAGREARLQFRRDGLECVNTGADQTLVGANARVEDCGQHVSIVNHTVLTLSAGSYTVDARMRVSNLAIDVMGTQCVFRVTEVPR